jgi:hypothetical protein
MEGIHMKRTICLLLAAVLLALPACAALAESGQTFTTEYYTLTLPADWTIDTSNLESEEDFQVLGSFYSPENPGLVIEAGLVHYADMSDVSLWNADEETMQNYIDAVMEDMKDENPEYVSTLKVGAIPFLVFKVSDEDGPFYYIDTMTNGYAVVFYAYSAGSDSDALLHMSQAEWAQVESILSTFKPAG